MGIVDSKHRHFGIFWMVIKSLDCFLMIIICSFVVSLYICMYAMCIFMYAVVVLYTVCVCPLAEKSGSVDCFEIINKCDLV